MITSANSLLTGRDGKCRTSIESGLHMVGEMVGDHEIEFSSVFVPETIGKSFIPEFEANLIERRSSLAVRGQPPSGHR